MNELAGSIEAGGALLGTLLLVVGMSVLRWLWLRRRRFHRVGVATGWLLIAAGIVACAFAWGVELGTPVGLLLLSAVAYVLIAAGVELRSSPRRAPRELALEPEERATNWRRAAAKSFLAIILAGVASIGIGVAFAVAMPFDVKDRIVIGGILVPILWGGGMAWTLSDAKLVRATLLLSAISLIAYAVAFLPKLVLAP